MASSPYIPKPISAVTRDTLSSRNSSVDRLSVLPSKINTSVDHLSSPPITPSFKNQDHLLKSQDLIQCFKQLSSQFNKYQNKSGSASRCNYLRLTLLSFLRSESQLSLPTDLHSLPIETCSSVLQCISQAIQVLTKFWLSLITELFNNWKTISFVDKTCYLECISRLMSRNEWIHAENQEVYKDLLILTLNLIFKRLFNLKILSIGLNAFIGKVFAYSFFALPKFADVLLFSLFIRNRSLQEFSLFEASINNDSNLDFEYPPHLKDLINYRGDYKIDDSSDPHLLNRNCMIPPRFTNFNIQVIDDEFSNNYSDSLEPHEVLSIDLKDTNWVKRWAGFDSDIFKSFLKHYLETSLYYQEKQINKSKEDFDKLLSFVRLQPGGILIYSHLMQIFDSNFKMLKTFRRLQFKENSNPNQNNINNEMVAFYSSNIKNNANKNYQIYLSGIPFLKFFKVLETLIYSSNYIDVSLMIKYFESILLLRARKTSPFNTDDCEVMYDILLEFCLKLNNNSKKPVFSSIGQSISNNDLLNHINWEFWVVGLIQMIKTENMVSTAKALSYIFNLWEMIPYDAYFDQSPLDIFSAPLPEISKNLGWIIDRNYTLLYNLSMFLISKSIWENLFIHWQPLIRHFYHRLIVFKIVGVNNEIKVLNEIVQLKLTQTHDLFLKYYSENKSYNPSLLKFELLPSMPIFNKKLIISYSNSESVPLQHLDIPANSSTPTLSITKRNKSYVNILETSSLGGSRSSSSSIKNSHSSSNLMMPSLLSSKKVYAFDIFDDAIYSSSVATSPYTFSARSPSSNNDSSVSSKIGAGSSTDSIKSRSSSASTSTLKKNPIISTALSFFKKVNDSITHETERSTKPKTLSVPTISTTPRTPPMKQYDLDQTHSMYGYSGHSSPSSTSEVSEYDTAQLQPQQQLTPKLSSPLLSISKTRARQLSSPSSRVSSSTSLISMISQNSQFNISTMTSNGQKSQNSNGSTIITTGLSSGYEGYTMESIPSPPELLIKIPLSKSFKYKYQLIFSNDSFQNTFYHNKLSLGDKRKGFKNGRNGERLENPELKSPNMNGGTIKNNGSKKQLFFAMDEIINDSTEIIPLKPRLPKKVYSSSESKITGIGLTSSSSFDERDEDFQSLPDHSEFNSDNELEEGSEEVDVVKKSKFSEWLSSYSSSSSLSSLNQIKRSNGHSGNPELYASTYKGGNIHNIEENWTILGKVINEWNAIVNEYERYLEVLSNDEKNELKNDEFYQWLKDPMLMCDIPPTKNMFGDKDVVPPKK